MGQTAKYIMFSCLLPHSLHLLFFNNFYYICYTYLTHDYTLIAFPIWNVTRIYLFFTPKNRVGQTASLGARI